MKAQKPPRIMNVLMDLLLALILLALYVFTSQPEARAVMGFYYAPVYRGQTAKNQVSLQFTVSWDAKAMEPILNILKEQGTTATFAVSGEWAKNHPGLLLRMVQEGHEIATMGQNPDFDGRTGAVTADVAASLDAIEAACSVRPVLYYSGSRDVTISGRAAKRLKLTQVLCTIDLMCARGTAEDILDRVSTSVIEGSIILLQPTKMAENALPGLLELLKTKGYRVVPTGVLIST